jgi:dipeptidase
MRAIKLFFISVNIIAGVQLADACTNFIVTKGASVNGSTMITYSADSHVLYGELYFWPAATHSPGTMLDIYEWDTSKFLGKIKQPAKTWSVIGNMNEFQLTIGETTFGGRDTLRDRSGIMDYGSLIYVTLQRAKNAREAIKVISELVNEYGYYSSGESFSIADPNEAWIFEIIGKGNGVKGAVWVALRIPDGYVSAHANQARIQTFPLKDGKKSITDQEFSKLNLPEIECIYSHDVIDVARKFGWFSGKDKEFSFSDTYAPVDFGGARFCDMRVWSFFKDINKDMYKYFDYVSGKDLTNRMPLWIKPERKLSNLDLMNFMRDHLEGTPLDMRKDAGAGPFGLPYRWRPLTWTVENDGVIEEYCNERATATQQSGFVFVSECRSWLPDPIGGIHWFGVDDAATTVFNPIYCGSLSVPESFKVGNGDLLTYSPTSAFWVFNYVANLCYLRYDSMSADAIKLQQELEKKYVHYVEATDEAAVLLHSRNPEMAREFITDFSVRTAESTVSKWRELGEFLLVKYMDGNIKKEINGEFLRNEYGYPANPNFPGYPDSWKRILIEETGDKLRVIKP